MYCGYSLESLAEAILISMHNICFYGELTKIILELSLNTLLIWPSVYPMKNLNRDMTKPVYAICIQMVTIVAIWANARQNQQNDLRAQQRLRSDWADQSDQNLWAAKDLCIFMQTVIRMGGLSLHWAHGSFCWFCRAAAHIWNSKTLASFCSWAGWFESYLVRPIFSWRSSPV